MTEATFPLLGTAFVLVVVLPVGALLAKLALSLVESTRRGAFDHLNLRFVLIAGSSLLPLAWFLSAGLHQAESGASALGCLFEHHTEELCFEPGIFIGLLTSAIAALSVRVVRSGYGVHAASSSAALELTQRLERIVVSHPALAPLQSRLVVTESTGFALGTQGLLWPRVLVGLQFGERASDEMLASALGHECEHVRTRDPLRFMILQLALAINPFGRVLLSGHLARWQAAREAHCDREAVLHGAAPLSLADAIVKAAQPSFRRAVALGTSDTAVLKFRVGILLAFTEKPPVRCSHDSASVLPVVFALLVAALLLPHQTGTAALDALHAGSEHAITYILH